MGGRGRRLIDCAYCCVQVLCEEGKATPEDGDFAAK